MEERTTGKRICKRCLTREMAGEKAVYETVKRYIEDMDPQERTGEEEYERRLGICKNCDLLLDGMFTHYAVADSLDPDCVAYTAAQTEKFFAVRDELEKLIGRLENDDMPLDKAFETYKKGITLLAECNKSVERVEKELKILESV